MSQIKATIEREPVRIDIPIPQPPLPINDISKIPPDQIIPPGTPIIVPNELPADKDPLGGQKRYCLVIHWLIITKSG